MITRVSWVLLVAALALFAAVPLNWRDQAEFGAATLVVVMVLHRVSRHRLVTIALIVISLFSSSRYLYWRISETVSQLWNNRGAIDPIDLIFIVPLLVAEFYAFVVLVLGYFQTIRPLRRKPVPLPDDVSRWPSVDIFIPTYNESLDVVRPTVLASLNVDWPADRFEVYLLDDGRRPAFREFAEACGATYLIRPDNKHAKAGNINHALKTTKGQFIAIFDCDHIPTRSFLQVTMGWMLRDPRMAMVQTPHHFYSPDPFERNLGTFRDVPNEGSLFYGVVQDGSDLWNAAFFCGSCAVIRREALEQIGGVAVETVTEDAHTSLRMQRRGWNTSFLTIPQAAGLATDSLVAHIGQRIRWARGMVQIIRTENPLFASGLKLYQRLCYFNSAAHYLYAIPRLIFLTSPMVYLLFGRSNLVGYVGAIAAYGFPHLFLATMTNSRVQGEHRHSFWNEVYETILAPYILLPTTIALIDPSKGKFNVTAKGSVVDDSFFDWHIARPYIALLFLNFTGVIVAIYRLFYHLAPPETVVMNLLWSAFNAMILGASIAVAAEAKQQRANARIASSMPFHIHLPDGVAIATISDDISFGGAKLHPLEPCHLVVGQSARMSYANNTDRYEFPITVTGLGTGHVRVKFEAMDLATQSQLVQVIYGRADSWMSWRTSDDPDRPLRSFLQLARYSLRGVWAMVRALSPRKSKFPQGALAAQTAARVIGLLCVLLSLHGVARAQNSIGATAPDSRTFDEVSDLGSFGAREPLMLRGTDATSTVFFRIPLTRVPSGASLQVRYRASANLLRGASTLAVSLNGKVAAQIPLGQGEDVPASIAGVAVDLPADLLTTENSLSFRVRGACAYACGSGGQPDVWTRIELTTALHLTGAVLHLSNDLAIMPAPFFDSSLQRTIDVQIAFLHPPDNRELEAAGIVASWFGILADYRGIRFSVSIGQIPRGNVVLVANRNSGVPETLNVASARGPAIAIRDNPNDADGKLLVVTGDDDWQLLAAAQALATGRVLLKGDIGGITLADQQVASSAYDAPRWLRTDRHIGLGELVSPDRLRVVADGTVNLYFRLPPDLYLDNRDTIPFNLRYRCAGLGTAVGRREIRVSLNGKYLQAKSLNTSSTKRAVTEIFALPVSLLSQANTLSVAFSFGQRASDVGESGTSPEAIVMKDSTVILDGIPHFTELPKLELFANAGFPFTMFADLSQTAVVLSDRSQTTEIEAYLSMLAFFSARTGSPGLKISVVDPAEATHIKDKDLLVLASPRGPALPALWTQRLGVQNAGGQLSVAEPLGIFPWLQSLPWTVYGNQREQMRALLSGQRNPELLLQQFASPVSANRAVTVIEAEDSAALQPLESIFAGTLSASDIFGSVCVYQGGRFHSFRATAPEARVGHMNWFSAFNYWAKSYFLAIPFIVALFALVLARAANLRLERWAHARLEQGL